MPGPKPKPTALKLIAGNPGRRPVGKKEPKPAPSRVAPPTHLNGYARAEWKRMAGELHALGLLTRIDRAALAAYCQAYGRWVQAEKALATMAERDQLTAALMIKTTNGNAIQNPLVGTANKAMLMMVRLAAEFGMTPAARTRIEATPPPYGDEDEGRHAYF